MARSKEEKLAHLSGQVNKGVNFKADTPHEAYPRASLYRRRVNQYFEHALQVGENLTVPGLALWLGVRTRMLLSYDPPDESFREYARITDYALQRIEAYTVDRLFQTKGSTKGIEFLAQNSLGYANKQDVNSKQTMEITEKERIKNLSDSELKGRILRLVPKMQEAAESTEDKPINF